MINFDRLLESFVLGENETEIPEPGNKIRTKKMQMEGVVEKIGKTSWGTPEVYFRVADGRLMKTPLSNVIIIQKLEDETTKRKKYYFNVEHYNQDLARQAGLKQDQNGWYVISNRAVYSNAVRMFGQPTKTVPINEVSNELLARYKTAAAKDAREADKRGDFKKGDKRFSGILKATQKQFDNDKKKRETSEGSMGGINRSRPETDVSYEKVLGEKLKDLLGKV